MANIDLIKKLCSLTQEELIKVLKRYLQDRYKEITVTDKYIVAEGEIPICLCAHLDTVGQKPPTNIYYDPEAEVMWSPQLLGADDRAGIYSIISIIERGYRPSIIFTTDEEIGAMGARALVSEKPKCPLENLKAIIELDRHGSNDSVYYDFDNKDFERYINKYGFRTALGSFTDISILASAWEIPAVNLSIGYYDEHSLIEHLKLDELENTIVKVCKILDDSLTMPKFTYKEKEYVVNWNYNFIPSKKGLCEFCLNKIEGKHKILYGMKVCKDCYTAYLDT